MSLRIDDLILYGLMILASTNRVNIGLDNGLLFVYAMILSHYLDNGDLSLAIQE